jgi:hypothetical protein
MRTISRSSVYASALLLAGTAALAMPAAAQASAALAGPPVVPCSSSALVAAIQQANSARFATLVLSRGCNYVLTTAASGKDGLPPITGNLVVLGSGGTTISRSSSAAFRIFDVAPHARLALANLTVVNGNSGNEVGGGILDLGTLVLRNVRLTGNTAPSGGGLAVQNGAHATISFSELDGNNAAAIAGGAIDNSADLVIDHSRVTGNTAHDFGGGVFTSDPGTSRITRTVVARNVAGRTGGGIVNTTGATTVLTLDRVVFNSAGSGGGIFNGGTVLLRFTLVAFNSPDNCSPQGTIRGCRN